MPPVATHADWMIAEHPPALQHPPVEGQMPAVEHAVPSSWYCEFATAEHAAGVIS